MLLTLRSRLLPLTACGALILGLSACGGSKAANTSPSTPGAPGGTTTTMNSSQLNAPTASTKNTTRIDAGDTVAVAAETALTMYPSVASDLRPDAVVFAEDNDWRSMLLASSFEARPLGFPLLLLNGRAVPPATAAALASLSPDGSPLMNRAQGIRIGVATAPSNLRTRFLTASTPAGIARAADKQLAKARGGPSNRVMIVNSEDPASAAPAAYWAAYSGDPILFATKGSLPADTKAALLTHVNPRVYVLGDDNLIGRNVVSQIQELGATVQRIHPAIAAGGPADLAIAFAKYSDQDMGFNYNNAGHGFAFAPTNDPTSAIAAAGLAAGGTYPALLLVDNANHLSPALRSYMLDVQPGWSAIVKPTQGVYNHGWFIGPSTAISIDVQSRIDGLMEIQQTDTSAAQATSSNGAANQGSSTTGAATGGG